MKNDGLCGISGRVFLETLKLRLVMLWIYNENKWFLLLKR